MDASKLVTNCDWDKYGAGSSIVVLDYDIKMKKFIVMKRIEVPRGEYSLDNAVSKTIEVNDIYDPRWIFVDRGYGDYQLERLHLFGEKHPSTGLKNKVEGYQFKQLIDVPNPVRRTITKEPLKPFMVNALAKVFEDHKIILSPFDDILHKQLIDYCVDRVTQSGLPVYTSKNEHFVDALGLAYLAMVLKFPEIAGFIKEIEHSSKIVAAESLYLNRVDHDIKRIEAVRDPWGSPNRPVHQIGKGPGERAGEYQQWVKGPEKITGHGYSLKVSAPRQTRTINSGFSRSPRSGGGGRTLW